VNMGGHGHADTTISLLPRWLKRFSPNLGK
jgi:hypothetical protein